MSWGKNDEEENMPDLCLGNVFQLPRRRISRRWNRRGTNLVNFLEALCEQTNLFLREMKILMCFLNVNWNLILGFHSRVKAEIQMETFYYRKSRIWEMKEDKCKKGLTKNQVYAIVHRRDSRKNVLHKFIELCMETPCLCPFEGHKYGRRKPTETSVFEFPTYAWILRLRNS